MPNRILKDSICRSETLDGLSWFEEVLFYRLIVSCDDYGRFDGRPMIVKNLLFPLKNDLPVDAVSDALLSLARKGLVVLYSFDGKRYLYLPTWNEHQSPRAKNSKYPAPENGTIENVCENEHESERLCENVKSDENICKHMSEDESNIRIRYSNSNSSNDIRYSSNETDNARARAKEAFDAFWTAYPRKVAKKTAEKAFSKVEQSAYPLLLPALERHKRSRQWTKDGGDYIPNPSTWLNQRRWEDDTPDARFAPEERGNPFLDIAEELEARERDGF